MMRDRLLRTVGSTLLLIGAFAIGWALHRSFVVGDVPFGSPPFVFAIVGGLVLVAAGGYLEKQFDPVEYVLRRQRPDRAADEEEPISPLTDPDLEEREEDG